VCEHVEHTSSQGRWCAAGLVYCASFRVVTRPSMQGSGTTGPMNKSAISDNALRQNSGLGSEKGDRWLTTNRQVLATRRAQLRPVRLGPCHVNMRFGECEMPSICVHVSHTTTSLHSRSTHLVSHIDLHCGCAVRHRCCGLYHCIVDGGSLLHSLVLLTRLGGISCRLCRVVSDVLLKR
jgi:hypothetical protein